MDEQEIARQRELASKATPRPWEVESDLRPNIFSKNMRGGYEDSGHIMTVDHGKRHDGNENIGWQSKQYNQNDADYIVAAVNTHEALLDEIAQQRAEIARLKRALGKYANKYNWTSHAGDPVIVKREGGLTVEEWIGSDDEGWQIAADALKVGGDE